MTQRVQIVYKMAKKNFSLLITEPLQVLLENRAQRSGTPTLAR